MIGATSQALAVRYVQKPQDGHADTVAKLSFSPSFVTYNPVTIKNIQDFFKTGEVSLHCKDLAVGSLNHLVKVLLALNFPAIMGC